MKKTFLFSIGIAFHLFLVMGFTAPPAQAVMMQASYTAQIDLMFCSGVITRDIFRDSPLVSWTVTFDDEGTEYHHYSDDDGSIVYTSNLHPAYMVTGEYQSDAVFEFDDTLERYFSYSMDTMDTHHAAHMVYDFEGDPLNPALNTVSSYAKDGVRIYTSFIGSPGRISISTGHPDYGESIGYLVWSVEYSPAPVPEPATLLLLGTGLAGIAGSRLRRKRSTNKG